MTAYNPTYITSMYTRPPNPPRVLLMSELEVRFCLYLTHAGHSKYYMGVLFRWDVNYSQPVSPRFHLSGVYHLDDLPCFSPSSRWVFAISSPRCRDFYWLTWSLQARGPAYTDMWHPAMQGPWYLVENATKWTYACVSDVLVLIIGPQKTTCQRIGNSKLASIVPHEGSGDGRDR